MNPLNEHFTYKGFEYIQEWRNENFAIYSQLLDGDLLGYESIRIKKNISYERFGKIFEASESYPTDNQWGVNGFTSKSFGEAQKILLKHFPKIQNLPSAKSVEPRTQYDPMSDINNKNEVLNDYVE